MCARRTANSILTSTSSLPGPLTVSSWISAPETPRSPVGRGTCNNRAGATRRVKYDSCCFSSRILACQMCRYRTTPVAREVGSARGSAAPGIFRAKIVSRHPVDVVVPKSTHDLSLKTGDLRKEKTLMSLRPLKT